MKKITQLEAAERGLTFYFTGKPCVRQHRAPRYVVNGHCATCLAEYNEKRRKRLAELRRKARDAQRQRALDILEPSAA